MNRAFSFMPLLIVLSGCREHPPASSTDAAPIRFNPEGVKVMQPVAGQRFTPTSSALVSFDTQTGQLCKTYAWGGSVMETGITPCEWLQKAPTETAKAP